MCHRSLWEERKYKEAVLESRKCPCYQQVTVAYQEVQKGGNNPQNNGLREKMAGGKIKWTTETAENRSI